MQINGENISALNSNVLFEFMDETYGSQGKFKERSSGSIIIANIQKRQSGANRWVRILAVGPKVTQVGVGEFALVENGQWTLSCEYQGSKFWKTDESKLMLATLDEKETYDF